MEFWGWFWGFLTDYKWYFAVVFILVMLALITICITIWVPRLRRKNLDWNYVQEPTSPEMPEECRQVPESTEAEPSEPEGPLEPDYIEMGDWTIYPECPHCLAQLKKVGAICNREDVESANFIFHKERTTLCFCPECKQLLSMSL